MRRRKRITDGEPNMTGASLLVQALKSAGVARIFSLSGNQVLPIYDACLDHGIELIHVRHEAAAVHMADAWGRLTGQPGVALVTAGSGHANCMGALFVALAAESPMVLLSGGGALADRGRGGFQEMAQDRMAEPVTKVAWTAPVADQLGADIAQALRTANEGRPGPVHLSLPVDLLEADVPDSDNLLPDATEFKSDVRGLEPDAAETCLAALEQAQRPLVLVGPALMRPHTTQLREQFATATGVPILGMESPRGVNDPAAGDLAGVLGRADVVLLAGKALDFTLRFGAAPPMAEGSRLMAIDAEAAMLERARRNVSDPARWILSAEADPQAALAELATIAAGRRSQHANWAEEVRSALARRVEPWRRSAADAPALHPEEICRGVARWIDESNESVLVTDGGEFGQWVQAVLCGSERVINGPSGTIGGSIPSALAARLARPSARVVALLGDGTFGFHALEFDTAVRYGLPFVAVVGNDAGWNAERQLQIRNYGPDRMNACDLLPTRYDQLVESLGGHGEWVTAPEQFEPALERAFTANRPACVNVLMRPEPAPTLH